MRTIPLTAREPRPFTPKPLIAKFEEARAEFDAKKKGKDKASAKYGPKKPVFHIAVPTLSERETISSLMFELGVVQVSRDTIRHAILEFLLAKGVPNYPDEDGEETALFLESHWQQTQIYEDQMDFWQQQENQRLIDLWHSPEKAREVPADVPKPLTTMRDRLRAKRVVDEVVAVDPHLRRLLATQTAHARLNQIMMMRVHLRGWDNLDTPREAEGGGVTGVDLVTEDCLSMLREEIGDPAWYELRREIMGQYELGAEEVGNSDSPPENMSPNTGSTPSPEEGSGDSHGTDTEAKSSSEPTPASE